MKLNAKELRTVDESVVQDQLKNLKKHPLYFILENVYDTYNVGGLFRLADAIGVSKMYLCGEMEIPPNSKIKKASIGTYKVVPWEYYKSASEVIADLKSNVKGQMSKVQIKDKRGETAEVNEAKQTVQIVAIEQSTNSLPFTEIQYNFPLAVIVGNETSGVTQETLALADHIAEIPMWGINRSLNVIVSAAIVSYHIMGQYNRPEQGVSQ